MAKPSSSASNEPSAAPARANDSPAAAEGRRILSTAFVRVGPDGQLTVDLRDGRTLILRSVNVGATEFCGELVSGTYAGKKFCGVFADVSSAKPGGAPVAESPNLVTGVPIRPAGGPTKP